MPDLLPILIAASGLAGVVGFVFYRLGWMRGYGHCADVTLAQLEQHHAKCDGFWQRLQDTHEPEWAAMNQGRRT